MHDAAAVPQQHVAAGLARQVAAEVLVGGEDDLLVRRQLRDDLLGRGGGDDDVAVRLHRCRAVDVGQRDMVGVRGAEGGKFLRRTAVLQAASGAHVGEDHGLLRAQDLRHLGHEADAAEGDDVGIGLGRLLRQVEAVADEIREVLQRRFLIVMRQDDGVAFLAEAIDLGAQVEAGAEQVEACVHQACNLPLSPFVVSPSNHEVAEAEQPRPSTGSGRTEGWVRFIPPGNARRRLPGPRPPPAAARRCAGPRRGGRRGRGASAPGCAPRPAARCGAGRGWRRPSGVPRR